MRVSTQRQVRSSEGAQRRSARQAFEVIEAGGAIFGSDAQPDRQIALAGACWRGTDLPNTKYRSRSALLQERASKLASSGGELTTRVEPATIGCEAWSVIRIATAREHLRKPHNDTQMIWGGFILMIGRLLHCRLESRRQDERRCHIRVPFISSMNERCEPSFDAAVASLRSFIDEREMGTDFRRCCRKLAAIVARLR